MGDQIYYRVWSQSTNTEYANVSVTYSQGDGIYAVNGIYVLSSLSIVITSVEANEGFPKESHLSQNYPNPFNPTTTIQYDLPVAGFVTLKVFDVLGREVAVLVQENQKAGRYNVTFNAEGLPSGVYLYRLQAGEFVETKKLILLR